MKLLTTSILWVIAILASANDGSFYVNGNQIVPLQETDVAVTKEVLTICIQDDGYASVDVLYEFTNRGAAKVVDVGFEASSPYNTGDDLDRSGKHPYIYDFTVEMNGAKLPIRNYVVHHSSEDEPTDFVPLDLNQWRDLEDSDDAISLASSISRQKKTSTIPMHIVSKPTLRRARMWFITLTDIRCQGESITISAFLIG